MSAIGVCLGSCVGLGQKRGGAGDDTGIAIVVIEFACRFNLLIEEGFDPTLLALFFLGALTRKHATTTKLSPAQITPMGLHLIQQILKIVKLSIT